MKRKTFGLGFVEEFSKSNPKGKHFKKQSEINWKDSLIPRFDLSENVLIQNRWRVAVLCCISLIFFFLVFLRLFHLQVVKGQENLKLADGNRIQIRAIHAPRGVIFDRNGKILAQNNPGFRLANKLPDGQTKYKYIGREEALKMESENTSNLAKLEIDSIRVYPMGEQTAHVLGYVSEVTEDELKSPEYKRYKPGDRIGRGGVEEQYEDVLKGTDGGEVIEVDAMGQKVRTLRTQDAIPGQNLYLSIDADLQKLSFEKLAAQIQKVGSCCGVVIAEDPQNGQILALVSLPSFDPKDLEGALKAPNSPILNRAIAGVYPPGSTYKIASSLAGLASGKINPATQFEDTGQINLGAFKFTNWYFTQYGKVEGQVDMIKALKRSNDIYFYRLGETIGEATLGEFSKRMGLGKKLGIDIPGEDTGLIPDNEWKEKNFGESWYPGDTLHMAIGQGFLLTTPLQVANLSAIIASDGKLNQPHLAMNTTDPSGKLIKEFKFGSIDKLFNPKDIDVVRKGLELVPQYGGTAWPFFTFPIPTAGKTGTAEFGDAKGKTHAWYTSYAPANDPRIAITVLIEAGGEGSSVAAPVVKELYRWYLSEDKNDLVKDLGSVATESARTLGE